MIVYHTKLRKPNERLSECLFLLSPSRAQTIWRDADPEYVYVPVAAVFSKDLEVAFQLTNHIDSAWNNNPNVEAAPGKQRSTSVGDLIRKSDGTLWMVDFAGFSQVQA